MLILFYETIDRDIKHALIGQLRLETTETWIIFVIIFMKAVDRDIEHALMVIYILKQLKPGSFLS